MKKRRKIDLNTMLQFILGMVLGGGISVIFFTTIDKGGLNKPAGYELLLLATFISIYYGSVIIHELTHFITFIIYGIEMRLFIVGPFIFIKEKNKWNFKFKFTTAFAMGGIAMPNLGVIDNERKFKNYRKAFAKVLIAAPLSNIVVNIMVIIIAILSYNYVENEIWRSYIVFIGVMTTIVALFLNLSSLIKNDLVLGDYRAYYEVLKDRDFVFISFYQYLIISDKYKVEDKKYLTDNILVYLQKQLEIKSFNTYTIGILDFMVNNYITGKEEELPQVVEEYIDFVVKNCEDLLKAFPIKEHPLILLHHIVLYYSSKDGYKDKAMDLYNKIITLASHKTKVLKYYDLRSRHILGIEDNLKFIIEKKNIRSSSLYELWRMFSWYYEDEIKMLENFR